MAYFSQKSTLLAGVSAVVLAATVGVSGAFAQVRTTTHSTGDDTYADGTAGDAGIAGARSGDILRINNGKVTINHDSNDGGSGGRNAEGKVELGGLIGAGGTLELTSNEATDIDVTIESIAKQGVRAVDLSLVGVTGENASLKATVAGDAFVNDLTIDMNAVAVVNQKAEAIFSGGLRLDGNVTLNDNATSGNNGRTYLIFNGTGNQAIYGGDNSKILAASDGEGTIKILNGREDGASRIARVSVQVGTNAAKLRELTIGDAAKGGRGVFSKEVHVNQIDVISGNEEEEHATVEFRANLSGDVITLNDQVEGSGDSAKTVNATAVFNALDQNITVGHKIVGAAANEGRITVAGRPTRTVTFNGQVGLDGNTNKGLREINIGTSTGVGHAIFAHNSAVRAKAITVTGGDQSNETATAEFRAGLGASGNGNTVRVILDANRGGDAFIKFNAKNGDQDIYATIDGNLAVGNASTGQGRLFVYDGDNGAPNIITFQNAVGRTDNNPDRDGNQDGKLAAIFVGQNGTGVADDKKFAGRAVFKEDLRAGIVYIAGGNVDAEDSHVTIEKSLSANVSLNDYGNAKSTLVIGGAGRVAGATDAQTITGNIVAVGHGQGAVEIRNASTTTEGKKVSVTGNIGANERAVRSLLFADGATTISGNVFANSIDVASADGTTFNQSVVAPQNLKLSAAATFRGHVTTAKENSGVGFQFDGANGAATFAGTALQRVTGDISTNVTSGRGQITVSNTSAAGVIFEGQLGTNTNKLNTLNVSADAHVTFNKPVYLGGDLTVNGGSTITLGSALGDRTGVAAGAPFLAVGGVALGDASEADKVTIVLPNNFRSGTQRIIPGSVTLSEDNLAKIALKPTAFATFTFTANGVTANAQSTAQVARNLGGVTESQVEVAVAIVNAAADNAADPVLRLVNNIFSAANKAQARQLLEQLEPQETELGGATTAVVATGGQVAGVFSDRLSALRGGDGFAASRQTGFATGGYGLDKAFWMKPFGAWGKQSRTKDKKQTFAGYSTKGYGLALGADAPAGDGVRVGAAAAYSTTDVTGKGAAKAETDVKSWQVSVYGDYTADDYYVEGQLGYGRSAISTTSKVVALSRTRKADYDVNQVTASVGGGMPIPLGGAAFVTPTAGLSWARVGSASYTTKGLGSLNQKLSVSAVDVIVGSVGAKVHTRIKQTSGTLVPSARVGMSYDFAGDQTIVSGKYTKINRTVKIKGAKVEQFAGTAGLGLTYEDPRWSVGADYDLSVRSGYQGHAARLSAKLKF